MAAGLRQEPFWVAGDAVTSVSFAKALLARKHAAAPRK
jgi:hypothetical protein